MNITFIFYNIQKLLSIKYNHSLKKKSRNYKGLLKSIN